MNTLKNFIDSQAEELLQQSDLARLSGGNDDGSAEETNAFADCRTTNNCNGGNCSSQCGCNSQSPGQP